MGYVYNDPDALSGLEQVVAGQRRPPRQHPLDRRLHAAHRPGGDGSVALRPRLGADGLNIYDWGSEVNGNTQGETRADFYRELKEQVYPSWADTPIPQWKSRPTTGIVEGIVSSGGQPVDHATVCVEGHPETADYTDGSGWFALMDLPPGNHTLRFAAPGFADKLVNITIPQPGDIVTVNTTLNPLP